MDATISEAVMTKYLTHLVWIHKIPGALEWLIEHYNSFGELSPITYNKLGTFVICYAIAYLSFRPN